MKTVVVATAPVGEFKEISNQTEGWETKLLFLVLASTKIRFDNCTRPKINDEIQKELQKRGYAEICPKNSDQRFLIPNWIFD